MAELSANTFLFFSDVYTVGPILCSASYDMTTQNSGVTRGFLVLAAKSMKCTHDFSRGCTKIERKMLCSEISNA